MYSVLCRLLETQIQPERFRKNVLERKFVVFFLFPLILSARFKEALSVAAATTFEPLNRRDISISSSLTGGYSLIPFSDVQL